MKSNVPLSEDNILLNLDASDKYEAIHAICAHLFLSRKTKNPYLLFQDIVEREEKVSTFAGSLTAIPHALTLHITEPALTFARLKNDDFVWDGPDENVRFIFLHSVPVQDDLRKLRKNQSFVFSTIAQVISQADILELWNATEDKQLILDSLNSAFQAYQNTKTS